jgi:hypothetical protein
MFYDLKRTMAVMYLHERWQHMLKISDIHKFKLMFIFVKFEVFTAVTMKSAAYWDVTSCGSYKNQHSGGMYRPYYQGEKN